MASKSQYTSGGDEPYDGTVPPEYTNNVGDIFEALDSEKRVATFNQIVQGVEAKNIHKNVGASRSGVQHFIDDYKDLGLIEDPENGTYELTDKGQEIYDNVVVNTYQVVERFEYEEIRDEILNSGLTPEEIMNMAHEKKELTESTDERQ